MSTAIEEMLKKYDAKSIEEKKNAVKEILQEIVLCGLSRAGFFKKAAFCGGTALRIFYGLDRFSEDLDFSLEAPDSSFAMDSYFPLLEKEIRAYGLSVTINEKQKVNGSDIQSAFLKGNTKELLLSFYPNEQIRSGIQSNEVIKVKFEIDTDPPAFATFEHKYRLLPSPYEINLYDMPSLFAGKLHAVLCRSWKSRVKGRDLYDYVFYLSRGAKLNRKHLRARLVDSGYISESIECSLAEVKQMLRDRFAAIDYTQAKQDVLPFVKNPSSLEVWSSDFFVGTTERLEEV